MMKIYIWHNLNSVGEPVNRIQDTIIVSQVPAVGDVLRYWIGAGAMWCVVERVLWDHPYGGEDRGLRPFLETRPATREEEPTFRPVNSCPDPNKEK